MMIFIDIELMNIDI